MEYDVNILNVGDADAIVINYCDEERWWTAVVDAGNVGDAAEVKRHIKHVNGNTYFIDHAFCTHPDRDHKGGFFGLLEDRKVVINNFHMMNAVDSLIHDPRRFANGVDLAEAAKKLYNHPTDATKNLIDLINAKGCYLNGQPILGNDVAGMPLKFIGPEKNYFKDAAYEMALDFHELEPDADEDLYDEDEVLSDEDAISVMDVEMEVSATNKSSMILLFHPDNRKFLLTGDACSASIRQAINTFRDAITGCTLKVPHHGSKHNMNTEVIDLLSPVSAVISCKGTKKHPSSAVVYWLSHYCNVYSTAKSGTLTYQSAPVTNPAVPLRRKME